MKSVSDILNKPQLDRDDIIRLLSIRERTEHEQLIKHAYSIKEQNIGRNVYLRGLIEFSNYCKKNCLYCGIRCGNTNVNRYSMTDKEILETVDLAIKNNAKVATADRILGKRLKENKIKLITIRQNRYLIEH